MKFLRKYEYFTLPIIAIFFSFVICGFIIAALGENPFKVYLIFFRSSLMTMDGIGYTLFYATPLIFTGLSVAFGFRCGLFNIGAEGQLYMGTIAATLVALSLDGYSAYWVIPLIFITSFTVGGLWGAVPGVLKATVGAHEVINTIMMNFVAYGIANYLVTGPFRRQGTQVLETEYIPEEFQIFRLNEIFPFINENVPVNAGFFIAIAACVFVYYFLWKTKWGYEIRSVGFNSPVAENSGINVKKNIVLSMFIAGGLSGLLAMHEVFGYRHAFHDNFSNDVGFFGIAIALLGRNHPAGIIPAALLFGILNRGGLFLDIYFDNLSADLVMALQGIIILSVAMDQLFRKLLFYKN